MGPQSHAQHSPVSPQQTIPAAYVPRSERPRSFPYLYRRWWGRWGDRSTAWLPGGDCAFLEFLGCPFQVSYCQFCVLWRWLGVIYFLSERCVTGLLGHRLGCLFNKYVLTTCCRKIPSGRWKVNKTWLLPSNNSVFLETDIEQLQKSIKCYTRGRYDVPQKHGGKNRFCLGYSREVTLNWVVRAEQGFVRLCLWEQSQEREWFKGRRVSGADSPAHYGCSVSNNLFPLGLCRPGLSLSHLLQLPAIAMLFQ